MNKFIAVFGGAALSLSLVGASSAGSFEESMSKCLTKHANTRDAATVMLECTAADGKLSNCSVVSDSSGGKGFDKAALCVAEALPMGSKTGQVKVPMRFPGS
ncbi:MAG: energy transducer TonB [Phenylobacterium sp.]|uniref:energy transducer TonB family protein n=1 Tax=Phenylobacterium sp. TaxID=1871053 RepID=UPI0039197B4A